MPRTASAPAGRFVVHPVQREDLRPVMRLAWRTSSPPLPYDFFEEVARHRRDYFRVVHDSRTHRVVGFVIAAPIPGLTENLLLLAIDPAHKGRGLRRALLRDVQDLLRFEGERNFSVEVRSADTETIDFYRRQDFEIVGVEAGSSPGRNDRVLLTKAL